jgi:DNA polymerase II small subunit
MKKEELLQYCSEKNLLLDNSLMNIFLNYDLKSIKILLDKIKVFFDKKFLNKSLINNNQEKIKQFIEEISILNEVDLNNLIKELGLKKLELKEKEKNKKEKKSFSKENNQVKVVSSFPCIAKSLEVKDFVTHFRNRYEFIKNLMQDYPDLENLISIGKIPNEKQKISVIGMVLNKRMTKNKNLILEIEDLTGKMKVVINSDKEELMTEAEDIPLDGILGFKGVGNKEIMFVNEIIFPETYLEKRKKSPVEEYALFTGDFHFGSKNFLYKSFEKFINYLNGEMGNKEEVEKIKYLFIVGDLITGIGNYPNQENDLIIGELEEQFRRIADLLGRIRKDVKIIISPGNHDCVRLMEPQPLLNEKFAWPLYELENVIITENPSIVNIGSKKDFEGFDVLIYHGFSFPYYANNVSKLMLRKAMNEPEKIMKYLLKNRHLSPTHGATQYFPLEKDGLLIRKAPDIFVSGHTHKSGVSYYNNILLISSSSWEGITPYQEKFGNKPDHCKVPLVNLKTRAIKILDFEMEHEGIKLHEEVEE